MVTINVVKIANGTIISEKNKMYRITKATEGMTGISEDDLTNKKITIKTNGKYIKDIVTIFPKESE